MEIQSSANDSRRTRTQSSSREMLDQDATQGQMIRDDSQVGYRFHGRTGQMNCLFLSGQEKQKTKTENLLDPTELLQTHQLI